VVETYPASDPVGNQGTTGARAVPPEDLLARPGAGPPPGSAKLSRRFPDAETANLALEAMVREGPIDRQHAHIARDGGSATLEIEVMPVDVARIEGLLVKHGALAD